MCDLAVDDDPDRDAVPCSDLRHDVVTRRHVDPHAAARTPQLGHALHRTKRHAGSDPDHQSVRVFSEYRCHT